MTSEQSQTVGAEDTGQDSPEVWIRHRERIKQLYLVDGLTREQTRVVMKDLYQFDVSDRQYRYQIEKKWQWQKTLTYEDKKFIILKTFKRQLQRGLPTEFLLCGREIDDSKLSRQRKGVIAAEIAISEAIKWDLGPLPRNLIYYTPPTSKNHDRTMDKPYCVTCLICERDFYAFGDDFLESFNWHLAFEHLVIMSKTAMLAWCSHMPKALSDCSAFDSVFEWDVDENKYTTRNPNSLAVLRSLTSVSIIQEDPHMNLWFVDNPDNTNTFEPVGLLTKSSDPTIWDIRSPSARRFIEILNRSPRGLKRSKPASDSQSSVKRYCQSQDLPVAIASDVKELVGNIRVDANEDGFLSPYFSENDDGLTLSATSSIQTNITFTESERQMRENSLGTVVDRVKERLNMAAAAHALVNVASELHFDDFSKRLFDEHIRWPSGKETSES